jgi:hypothetical protein
MMMTIFLNRNTIFKNKNTLSLVRSMVLARPVDPATQCSTFKSNAKEFQKKIDLKRVGTGNFIF